jgi:putative transposase-like DNA-binding protein
MTSDRDCLPYSLIGASATLRLNMRTGATARTGTVYVQMLLQTQGRDPEIDNEIQEDRADLTQDFKARRMNASLYASNLAHLPTQLAWGAAKRGVPDHQVKSADSSQECQQCHDVARENRPTQQTFCCGVCGHSTHADVNAAENLASRFGDRELAACVDRQAIKALLGRRHQAWVQEQEQEHRLAVVQPPAQLSRQWAQVNG